jgi:hypothetical protein
VSDTIKCLCQHCGAKYRLPLESQGRKARCKKCGEVFEVPKARSGDLEDSILDWLNEPDPDEETVAMPRVINMPKEAADPDGGQRARGIVRRKDDSVKAGH